MAHFIFSQYKVYNVIVSTGPPVALQWSPPHGIMSGIMKPYGVDE